MSEIFECGDAAALVAYLYDECEPETRDAITRHLTRCSACSGEIAGLGVARRSLVSWTPRMPELGFRIPAPVQEERTPWWRSPLPAWAQSMAAMLIFGAGLSIGLARGSAPDDTAASNQPATAAVLDTVSRGELTQLEQRLKSEMAQIRTAAPVQPVRAAASSDDEIMKKVEALVAQSEERQRRDFTLRSVEMAREFETQRRVDLASVRETLGPLQGVTGTELRQQREAIDRINNFIRVSQQGR